MHDKTVDYLVKTQHFGAKKEVKSGFIHFYTAGISKTHKRSKI